MEGLAPPMGVCLRVRTSASPPMAYTSDLQLTIQKIKIPEIRHSSLIVEFARSILTDL